MHISAHGSSSALGSICRRVWHHRGQLLWTTSSEFASNSLCMLVLTALCKEIVACDVLQAMACIFPLTALHLHEDRSAVAYGIIVVSFCGPLPVSLPPIAYVCLFSQLCARKSLRVMYSKRWHAYFRSRLFICMRIEVPSRMASSWSAFVDHFQ